MTYCPSHNTTNVKNMHLHRDSQPGHSYHGWKTLKIKVKPIIACACVCVSDNIN